MRCAHRIAKKANVSLMCKTTLTGIIGEGIRTMQCPGCLPEASHLEHRSKSSHEEHLYRKPTTEESQPSHFTPRWHRLAGPTTKKIKYYVFIIKKSWWLGCKYCF